MTSSELTDIVQPSALLNQEQLLNLNKEKTTSKKLLYRGELRPGENVVSNRYNSIVIVGSGSIFGIPYLCSAHHGTKYKSLLFTLSFTY